MTPQSLNQYIQSHLSSLFTLLIVFGFILSCDLRAQNEPEKQFSHLMQTINATLSKNQQKFQADKTFFASFVDQLLIANWSAESTIRGLAGKSIWQSLKPKDKQSLIQAFNDTLQRYAQEGFDYYEGQRIEFVDCKLNKSNNRGLLKVRVHPKLLPKFDIDFKIKRQADGWKLYDVMVQGVSYIRLKRDAFRTSLKESGLSGLLESWQAKNKGFIPSHWQNTAQLSEIPAGQNSFQQPAQNSPY